MIRVTWDAIYGTHFLALWCVEMADAFGAFVGINFVDQFPLVNGLIGTLWFAHVAVDAF